MKSVKKSNKKIELYLTLKSVEFKREDGIDDTHYISLYCTNDDQLPVKVSLSPEQFSQLMGKYNPAKFDWVDYVLTIKKLEE